LTIEPPGHLQAVDADAGVMENARIVRAELHRAHVCGRSQRHLDYEIPKDVRTVSLQRIRFRKLQDQVGLAQLPAIWPSGDRRPIGGITLDRSLLHPFLDRVDFLVVKPALVEELPVPSLWRPGWHQPAFGGLRDFTGAASNVLIVEHAERCRLA